MNKSVIAFYGAVDTYSGYGARARDIALSLIKLKEPEFEVKILSCPWGSTQRQFLKSDNPNHKLILDRIIPQLTKQPEVFIMNSVPNEMQKVGSVKNILITAGMESTLCLPEWVEGCNRADLVIVSSEHAKKVFQGSQFEKMDNATKKVVSIIKLTTPCEVLFEGVDLNVYHKLDPGINHTFDLSSIPESFCFLTVGSWLQGEFGQDRKNISGLIKIFLETFKNKKIAPALILKTHSAAPSVIDREEILDKIDSIRRSVKANILPEIYLLHGELTDSEMNGLYNNSKVKAFALLTKGEGFGRPLLEFSLTGKPIITTNFGGQTDFLDSQFTLLVGGKIEKIHPSAVVPNIFHAESAWLECNPAEASHMFKEVYENYDKYTEGAKRQAYKSKTHFSIDQMTLKLGTILDANIPKLSIPVTIKLPSLKKTPQL